MSYISKSIRREKITANIIRRRMLYAAGLGLIPIPILDAASILGTQVLMVRDIAKVYDVPFKKDTIRNFITVLVADFGTMGVVKAIPGVGSVLGGTALSFGAAAATYAIGKIFVQHFNQGGTLLDFDPVKSRRYFQKLFEEGQVKVKEAYKDNQGEEQLHEEVIFSKEKRKDVKRNPIKRARKWKGVWKSLFLLFAVIIFIFLVLCAFFYSKGIPSPSYADQVIVEPVITNVNLQPIENIDSTIIKGLLSFEQNSTEDLIARYIENPESTYPKRFILGAVRFTGSSLELNTGAKEQLQNLSFIMKKYPDLLIEFLGHTTNLGPKFNRQRIGRQRARVLKELIGKFGTDLYRVDCSFLEMPKRPYGDIWGADIIINVSTKEEKVKTHPESQ